MEIQRKNDITYKAVLDKIITMKKKSNDQTRIKFASISEAVAYAIRITKKKRSNNGDD